MNPVNPVRLRILLFITSLVCSLAIGSLFLSPDKIPVMIAKLYKARDPRTDDIWVLKTLSRADIQEATHQVMASPDDASAYYSLGLAYSESPYRPYRNTTLARACFDTAMVLNPRKPEYYLQMARVLIREKKYKPAQFYLNKGWPHTDSCSLQDREIYRDLRETTADYLRHTLPAVPALQDRKVQQSFEPVPSVTLQPAPQPGLVINTDRGHT